MVVKRRLLRDEVSFTADTDDILIVNPRYIDSINIGLDLLQNGATSPTLATMLDTLDTIQVKLGGRIITELTGEELFALNNLWLGKSIISVVPTADNESGSIQGLSIPLWLSPTEESLAIRFAYGTVATTDNEQLTFSVREADEPIKPAHVEIKRFEFTPPSTGAYNTALETTFTGDLIGLMIYSTTIPTTTNDNASAAKVRILVDGDLAWEGNWLEMKADAKRGAYDGDSTNRAILDNYVWLDFEDQPIKAGARIEIQIYSDDTNTVTLHPVIQVGA